MTLFRKIWNTVETVFFVLILAIAIFWAPTTWKCIDPFNKGYENTATFFNIEPVVILSGSMVGDEVDNVNPGDVAITVITSADEVKIGDVVSYDVGTKNKKNFIVIHRLVGTDENGEFIFKGDANNEVDTNPVSNSQIRGKLIFKIPYLGWFIYAEWYYKVGIVIVFMILYGVIHKIIDGDEEDVSHTVHDLLIDLENINKKIQKCNDPEKMNMLKIKQKNILDQIAYLRGESVQETVDEEPDTEEAEPEEDTKYEEIQNLFNEIQTGDNSDEVPSVKADDSYINNSVVPEKPAESIDDDICFDLRSDEEIEREEMSKNAVPLKEPLKDLDDLD